MPVDDPRGRRLRPFSTSVASAAGVIAAMIVAAACGSSGGTTSSPATNPAPTATTESTTTTAIVVVTEPSATSTTVRDTVPPSTDAMPSLDESALDLSVVLDGWNRQSGHGERTCGEVWWEQQQINQMRCTEMVAGHDGTLVTYDPTTRQVTRLQREGDEPVAFRLPDDAVDAWLLASGPEGVVYFGLETPWPSPSDVVAFSLTPDDAGREIERFPAAIGGADVDVLAAPTGLVVSGWYEPGPRPSAASEPSVPWIDPDGQPAAAVAAAGFDDAANIVVANGLQWSIDGRSVTSEAPGVSAVMPTFDDGFLASYRTSDGTRTELIRGWTDGTVEFAELPAALATVSLTLEAQGSLMFANGSSFTRVAPFDSRATGWTPDFDLDPDTGAAVAVGLDEFLATVQWGDDNGATVWPWGASPIAFADAVAGLMYAPQPELRTITATPAANGDTIVTVTTEGHFDDSVYGTRMTMVIGDRQPGLRLVEMHWTWACQPNRGHQDYQVEPCT